MTDQPKVDNLLHISWCDSRWVPILNANNILDYFSERSNPFYSRDCNNEFIKMQQNTRLDQLQHMQGVEYVLLHAQDPILYIVRKQQRYSTTQVSPSACYHIIAGQVFQTPDVGSVINSRLVSAINHINGAFSELQSFSQYHPSRGYWWQTQKQTPETVDTQKKTTEKKSARKEEISSVFQRRRVDSLMSDLASKFPYKPPVSQVAQVLSSSTLPQSSSLPATGQNPPTIQTSEASKTEDLKSDSIKVEVKTEIKTEPKPDMPSSTIPQRNSTKPPPEKRQKLLP